MFCMTVNWIECGDFHRTNSILLNEENGIYVVVDHLAFHYG